MKKVELLAPAGSFESLYAAINNGADAVYLGGDKFSARAYASNFDEENMIKAVDYVHMYGLKIYITINTLLKENEIKEAIKYVKFLYEIGVDGLIIQDLGLFNVVRNILPDFELHASTQMTIHNGDGALFLKEKGFKRIVLSRELSLKEIEYISKELDIETEIFVHGALCVCYSGMCLMSSMIGGRSGNRGRCAQSCRLPYTLKSLNGGKEFKGYLLSPKDICTIEDIKDIISTGTSSLKIEGRMKRPEYVAGVVKEYRKAISEGENKKGKDVLLKLFNREGFSKAYLYKNEGKDMMAYKFPKNTGVLLGRVDEKNQVVLQDDLSLKDGVRIGESGFIVSKIQVNGEQRENAYKGEKAIIFPKQYNRGDELFKTSDTLLLKQLSESYNNIYGKKINLDCIVIFEIGKPIEIIVKYADKTFSEKGEIIQKAEKRPLSKERIIDAIIKSGDNPFKIVNVIFEKYDEGFMPISALNEIRRKVIEKIQAYEISKYKRTLKTSNEITSSRDSKVEVMAPEKLFIVNTKEQLEALLDSGEQNIGVNIYNKSNKGISIEDVKKVKNKDIYLKLPHIIKNEYNQIVKDIEENISLFSGIITSNLGIVKRFNGKINIISDYKSNMFNSNTIRFFKENNVYPYISQELNRKEILNVLGKEKNFGMSVYGKTEVMISEYCPIGSTVGGKSSCNNCSAPCINEEFILRDRMNKDFRVLTDKFCRAYIYNPDTLNLISEMDELKEKGVTSFRFDFIDESKEEVNNILKSINNNSISLSGEYTKGHYRRGVE
ncbi:U32 family peptidase [Clostridium sp. 'White wine YQ']|uniref:U32 family peptidase n=1 Tax=Clostridium sp. 'White wine YQ' TaxID=3027474 RepID=UPI0023660284|nr:U32 family peptidase [Clostridium sp. 'White wine YQ']MDD7793995.1 U32 family peptidase [Clostridium sp. 'White wine YQ']